MTSPNWTRRLLAVLFCLALLLPLTAMRFGGLEPDVDLMENRNLAARPAWGDTNLTAFPAAYDAYFNDNFGWRQKLIQLNNLVRYKLFNVSTTEKVIAGRDGWLYYTGGGAARGIPATNHRGDLGVFDAGFLRHMTNYIESIRDHFAEHGIDYLLVVAPDKWSIYPEYLPDAYQSGDQSTCVEQLVAYLRANSTVPVLDLRHCLLAAKGQQWPVYLRGDTHWSDLGAFTATNEILATLQPRFPQVTPLLAADYEFKTVPAPVDGLTWMLGLRGLLSEETFAIVPRRPSPVVLSVDLAPKPLSLSASQDNSALPRAIMLRDSFAHAMVPYLSERFARIEYVWTAVARGTGLAREIDNVQPHIVIEMKVERYMLHTSKYYRINQKDFPLEQAD